MKIGKKALLAGLVLFAIGYATFVSTANARDGGACAVEIASVCSGAQDWRAVDECLSSNRAALSPACLQSVDARVARRQKRKAEFQAACGADISAFCPNVPASTPDERREVRRCLRVNANSLSAACQNELDRHRGHQGS